MSGAFDIVMESRREIVEKIIRMMEQEGFFLNVSEWNREALRPYNPLSGAVYKGSNRLRLTYEVMEQGYKDPRWATLRQYKENGYFPKKGEKGRLCEKWIFTKEKIVQNSKGQKEKIEERLDKPIVSYFKVFNAEQIRNFPKYVSERNVESDIGMMTDNLIETSECPVLELGQERACYVPSEDNIFLPLRQGFKNEKSFLQTLIHEMGHSTGHKSRLNRNLMGEFGSVDYAKEELRAELGALFTSWDLGIHLEEEHYEDHSDYLKSWIKVLRDDYNELFRAYSDAEKISERLLTNYDKKFLREVYREEKVKKSSQRIARTI